MSTSAEQRPNERTIPLQEGLYREDGGGKFHLLASRCPICRMSFFPKRKYCGKCGGSALDEIFLSDRGTIFSFSLIERKSKLSIIDPPYIQAEVVTAEGVRVYTVVDGCHPSAVHVGMEVELYVDKVKRDKDGNDLMAFKFRPPFGPTRPHFNELVQP